MTTKIKCGKCGANYCKYKSGTLKYWRCSHRCSNISLRENYLHQLLSEMLGDNFEERFTNEADRIIAAEILTIIFKDGHCEEVQWNPPKEKRPWSEKKRASFERSRKCQK